MTNVRENRRILKEAQSQGVIVRFVYHTKSTGELVPRVGTVREFTDENHVVLNDLGHDGAIRSAILDRIHGSVRIG